MVSGNFATDVSGPSMNKFNAQVISVTFHTSSLDLLIFP